MKSGASQRIKMIFSYVAKNEKGIESKGQIEASSEGEAGKILSEKKMFVISLKNEEKQIFAKVSLFKKGVSLKEKIIFTKELAMMVRSGLPLVDALEALKEQTESVTLSKAVADISNDIKGGATLSHSLSKFPKIFPNVYISITASGEKSGKLDEVLDRLAEQLQKDYDLMTKVKNAITYPIVIVVALLGIMTLMLTFVVPKMKTIFTEMGVELPAITQILLNTSDFVVKYWYIVILVIIGIVIFIKMWGDSKTGGFLLDRAKIKMPIFGALVVKVYMARFTRTMATLVASGLPMLEIVKTVKEVVGNNVYNPLFDQIYTDIESGVPLSQALKKHREFPVMIAQMVSTGEKSGKIDYVLFNVADFYDKEVEATTNNLTALIEPILILVIGAGVGVAIASVILPIYSLVNTI